ncbi:TcpE family conjugal transfer membrane protein [Oceanobacillus sp. FSL W8-0428]|uniref:TcpE family conjugal transfer membrane protein n=1 Tax=Oceanobacillus sp. FSL W8-0428 TaxID=2921715 RepID=UPI0030F896BC
MRVVFNYRKALREPKQLREIAPGVYLPFAIELLFAVNFLMFFAITLFVGNKIRDYFPHAFENTWVMFLLGIPLLMATLFKKIEPEGKNIYIYIYDLIKFFITIKMPKKQFVNDRRVAFADDKKITFKKCVQVVTDKYGESETSGKNNKKKYAVNERGRRVGILSNQE